MRHMLIIAVLGIVACDGQRTIVISSSRPAMIVDDGPGCLICENTPCSFTFSRETCWGFDSSIGYILLRAVLPDNRAKTIAVETCTLEEDERIFFDFEDGKAEVSETDVYLEKQGRAALW